MINRYAVNKECLTEELEEKFHQFYYDKETDDFIENCYTKSESLLSLIFYSALRSFLRLFMSSTSICGLLGKSAILEFVLGIQF